MLNSPNTHSLWFRVPILLSVVVMLLVPGHVGAVCGHYTSCQAIYDDLCDPHDGYCGCEEISAANYVWCEEDCGGYSQEVEVRIKSGWCWQCTFQVMSWCI
jgi:hypothetical protein